MNHKSEIPLRKRIDILFLYAHFYMNMVDYVFLLELSYLTFVTF